MRGTEETPDLHGVGWLVSPSLLLSPFCRENASSGPCVRGIKGRRCPSSQHNKLLPACHADCCPSLLLFSLLLCFSPAVAKLIRRH